MTRIDRAFIDARCREIIESAALIEADAAKHGRIATQSNANYIHAKVEAIRERMLRPTVDDRHLLDGVREGE